MSAPGQLRVTKAVIYQLLVTKTVRQALMCVTKTVVHVPTVVHQLLVTKTVRQALMCGPKLARLTVVMHELRVTKKFVMHAMTLAVLSATVRQAAGGQYTLVGK